ncbi:MAG: glutamate--tRNA ligase [Deltaproteobacteria bacterium RBG_16_48_10]|nr:MAG: glutamate--tRNA ligase [Deltaproteobacteria bacterium RBG_16_48_10]
MTSNVRVRFAPSPTGLLHIGNARTALFNFLFAKRNQGTFILRIEDTDLERSTDASMDDIIRDLRWLGVLWDEGPDRDGPDGPYRQSQRLSLYQDFAQRLLQGGRVYKCFCSLERLESLRKEQLSKGKMPRYDGRCRSLSVEEVAQMESQGQPSVLRFRVEGKSLLFVDLIHGKMNFNPRDIGDFIIVRSDGMAAYNFACVIDDHFMHMTHVIRGEDHLSNTPRQMMVYHAFGWEPPVFAHHPLILGPDRTPLSKRHGATAVSQYREEGFLPEALLNYLVLLGWASPSGEEILSLEKIIEEFSLSAISKSAPGHNRKKLEWLNSYYIRNKQDEDLSKMFLPYLQKAGFPLDQIDSLKITRMAQLVKDNLVILSDIDQYLGIFYDQKFSFDEGAKAILLDPISQETLRSVLGFLEKPSELKPEDQYPLLTQLEEKTGRKGKALYAPLRAGVTGKTKGPELVKTLPLLGRDRIIRRLKMALEASQ